MRYNKLGKTGFEVSEIGLGGEYLEGKEFTLVNDVVSAALDGGINILDCLSTIFIFLSIFNIFCR